MSVSPAQKLTCIAQLISKSKFNEALQSIENFENQKSLSSHDRLMSHVFKCTVWNKLGNYENALKLAEQVYYGAEKAGEHVLQIDALIVIVVALWRLGRLEESLSMIEQGEKLLKSVLGVESIEYKTRKSILIHEKGTIFWQKGDLKQALEFHQQGLTLSKELQNKQGMALSLRKIGFVYRHKGELDLSLEYLEQGLELWKGCGSKQDVATTLVGIGEVYRYKGELDRALEYHEQALALYKEIDNKSDLLGSLNNIGLTYYAKGDLDRAMEFLEQSLSLREEIYSPYRSETLFYLVLIAIDKKNQELAQRYLQRLYQYNEKKENKIVNQFYQVAEALVLKMSTRSRKRVKAEELLKKVIEEEPVYHEVTVMAFLNLCDLLLTELRTSGSPEVLEEVQSLVAQLVKISKEQHSYWLLAETCMLQSKLALVELDLEGARHLLTQAQHIAEERRLGRLARKISSEHDVLLSQLSKWKEFINRNASLAERIELAQLEDFVMRMIRKRTDEPPEVLTEKSIMLLILDAKGLCLFSMPFLPKSTLDEHLMGGFLTAIQAFSTQVFSQSIDRVKLEDYTLLLMTRTPFLICYVFKGHSYTAQQKLTYFTNNLQANTAIWQALIQTSQEGRVLNSKMKVALEALITEILLHH
ncbi:MAG: tetratricopeptide repeat protein [Candidatus Hodarchaeota archaeon]